MKYLKLFNESFHIEDVEDYLLSLIDSGYLKFTNYAFLDIHPSGRNSDYYLVYNYHIDSKFISMRTSEDIMEYSKFLANLASTFDRWKLKFEYVHVNDSGIDVIKLSVRQLIPSKICKFLNDNDIRLNTAITNGNFLYSKSLSMYFKLSIDLPKSSISKTGKHIEPRELDSTHLYSCSLILSKEDNNFILSFKVASHYMYYKKEDVVNSFVKTVKDQLDVIDYVFENDLHKFTISSKN